ncbi:MAG TPA: DUF6538 domain-containing protein, partial [Stellaceae bacterium]|nr:DUF6538 domain-containing protein [Stellaceae bacterium]
MYLERRRRRWYALHDIPADVQKVIGRRRFVQTLDTEDERTAKRRAVVLQVKWLAEIEQARTKRADHIEKDAAFWQRAFKEAAPEQRDVILSLIGDEAREMVDRAASKAGFMDEREEGYDELAVHPAAERFVDLATGKLVRLDAHLEEYLATLGNEAKTVDMKRSTVKKFAVTFAYITDVRRKDVQQWVNEQVQQGKKPATVQRSLSELRGYWSYLLSVEAAPADSLPFEKLSIPKPGKNGKADERKPFAPADVLKLLEEARGREDASLRDLIELAMWTGARIEELCALKVEKAHSGYLEIEDAKTPAGWRQVPVHSKLKDTVARLKKESADGYLLSGLTSNKYGDRSNAIGKRFGTLKTALGFGPDHVFHSIRKTVATLLENARVP